jgi:uncharacterized membrane protein
MKIIFIILIALPFLVSFYFYPIMPNQIASHWGIDGNVNGYMSKFWGLFFVPFIILGISILFVIIPKIDPLKSNIDKFRKYYYGFVVVFLLFMLFVHLQTVLWNAGHEVSFNLSLPIAIGILYICIGSILSKVHRNWFIGIRTPWTMSSDGVWRKTHELGAKLFIISGFISIMGVFFDRYSFYFILIPVIFSIIYTSAYSYFEYKKEGYKQI